MLDDDQMQKAFDYWRSHTAAEQKLMGPETRICVASIPDTLDTLPATGHFSMPYEYVSVYEILQWAGNKTDALINRATELVLEKGKYRELAFRYKCMLSTHVPDTILEAICEETLQRKAP